MTKSISRRGVIAIGAAGAASYALGGTSVVFGQAAYPNPNRQLRMIVPFAAGGGQDEFARRFLPTLGGGLGESFIIENRPGGNSILATQVTVGAEPDGYTLLQQTTSFTANPAVNKDLTFDSQKDLAPISLVARTPHVLVVNNDVPAKNVEEFIKVAKSSKDKLNYGSAGPGSTNHIAALMFMRATQTDMVHVPYKGAPQFMNDLMGGRIECVFGGAAQSSTMANAGRMRALAVTAANRIPSLPNVPTFKELGLDVELYSWTGYLAPAKTPRAIVEKLNAAMQASARDPKVIEKFPDHELVATTPEEFAAFLKKEFAIMADVLKDVKI